MKTERNVLLIDCRHTSSEPVSPLFAIGALRLNGVTIERPPEIGSLLGGPPPDVAPGQTWEHLVVLPLSRPMAADALPR